MTKAAGITYGTINGATGNESWDKGWDLAGSGNYDTIANNLAVYIWSNEDQNDKTKKPWPNCNPPDNDGISSILEGFDYDRQYASPAGLILKMECQIAFSDMSEISNSFWRVINVGDSITTTNFVAKYPDKRENLLGILEFIKDNPISSEDLATEQAKGAINHKPLPAALIEALQKDGYFDQ